MPARQYRSFLMEKLKLNLNLIKQLITRIQVHILLIYEAGESVVDVKTGTWNDLKALASPLRYEVFVNEQEIDPELEWDAADETAVYAVVLNKLGQAVATGRLLQPQSHVAQIGRMAVNKALRGGSLGRLVVSTLIDKARQRGDREVLLHAQCSAEGFYKRQGFEPHGEPFDEVGIPHIEMRRSLGLRPQMSSRSG